MDMPVITPQRNVAGQDRQLTRQAEGRTFQVTVTTRGRMACFADFHVAWTAVRAFRDPAALGDTCLLAWVLLPDQVSWLLEGGREMPLEKAISRMKSLSAVQVNRTLFRAGPLWEPGFSAHALAPGDDPREAARQLLVAPLRARLAGQLMDYPFWDCIWV